MRGVGLKINSMFEFGETIDLSKYMVDDAEADPTGPPIYRLHSVIVHSGTGQVCSGGMVPGLG